MNLEDFRKLSGLTISRSKTQVCPFGHMDNPSMLKLKDCTRLDFVSNFKLLSSTTTSQTWR